nr:hypothetical protein [Cytophagales bacterium]
MAILKTRQAFSIADNKDKPRPHSLKLKGQFAISSHLQQIALNHGLSIERMKGNTYEVSGFPDLDVICPKHIHRSGQFFDAQNLRTFLEFLHQPIGASSSSQEQRISTHRLLRFMQSGSVHISGYTDQVNKKSKDKHEDTERNMRYEKDWETSAEIGNPQSVISCVPETEFSGKKGFVFSIPIYKHEGKKQKELEKYFWSVVNDLTQNRYADKPETITLTATELYEFCRAVGQHQGQINSLISAIESEEAYQGHVSSVEDRIVKLEATPTCSKAELSLLMDATTALTPLLNSEEMRQIWARYHFMERHHAPFARISQQFQVMHAVMRKYAESGKISDAQAEAITLEFYPLLAFAKDVATILGETQIAEKIDKGYSSGISLSEHFMNTDHQAVLDDLQRATKQGGSSLKRFIRASWHSTRDFVLDVLHFIAERPKTAGLAFVTLSYILYTMNGGETETAQAVNNTIMTFGETGLEAVAINPETLSEEAKAAQNWHWDMGLFGLYKHYIYGDVVTGWSNTILDMPRMGIRSIYEGLGIPSDTEPKFSEAAAKTTEYVSGKLFNINMFQNLSHAGFWITMLSHGYRHGLKKGFKHLFDLLSPITDLAYTALRRTADILTFKKRTQLSDRLAGKEENHSLQNGTLHALGEAAQIREVVMPPSLKKKGLSFKFQVCAEHADDMIAALEQFDTVLAHIADKIGIKEPWYQKFLQDKIKQSTEALQRFKEDGDIDALNKRLDRNLTDLVAAQIRHTGQSNIVEMDEKTQNRLHTKANAMFGRTKRHDKTNASGNVVSFLGRTLWNSVVETARAAQRFGHLIPAKPILVGAAGAFATSVGLDMAGYDSSVTDTLSFLAGGITSGVVTTTTFLAYNFVEDVLGVHVGTGAGLLAAGAAAGYAYKKAIKPIVLGVSEPFRNEPETPSEP